jgi:hypothetical protein
VGKIHLGGKGLHWTVVPLNNKKKINSFTEMIMVRKPSQLIMRFL